MSNTTTTTKKTTAMSTATTTDTKETVKCLDCNTEHDLFYDLEHVTEVMSDGEQGVQG